MDNIRSGYIAILGLPNVGKSTLLNRIIANKIAIVTPKPQTTRNRILGIYYDDESQICFLDTPGVCEGDSGILPFLQKEIEKAYQDADAIIFIIDATYPEGKHESKKLEELDKIDKPKILVINKADKLKKPHILPIIEKFAARYSAWEIVPLSAINGDNVIELIKVCKQKLPIGPPIYPPDELTDLHVRFLASEIIREKVFLFTHAEVPYSTAVAILSFKEAEELVRIEADIVLERESQKAIVIGHSGEMLKKIGSDARKEIEHMVGKKVYLKLFVKVEKNWSKNYQKRKMLGYG